MGAHHPNPRRFKIHRTYTVGEIARICSVHKNTIARWRKSGLKPMEGNGQLLFRGHDVRDFLERRRRAAKCPLPPGFLYCLGCRDRKEPAGRMADLITTASGRGKPATTGDLKGLCPDCLAMMNRKVNLVKLKSIRGNLEITMRRASHA
jgi:hypothetical protein